MKKAHKVRVGISIGDLNGIGSEVILKTFADQRMLDFCTPVIFANNKLLSFYKKHFKMNINFQGVDDSKKIIDGKFNVVNIWKDNLKINFGEEDKFLGKFTLQSLEASTQALKNGDIDTLVTAPINKNVIQSDKFNFPGHTDYLAKHLGGGESLMFMISQNLKVGLLTDHVAVKEVSEVITPSLIEKKINMISNSLKADFKVRKPKIAILGINPHSGDNGVIGKEDEEVLKPTIKKLQDKGNLVYGPYAADSFFGTKNYQNFDAVVAAYHDQGLIPFKTLSFGNGVNFTAGLEKVRTSPDHGTAYEIAGKGEADYTSFKEAVFASIEIFKNRKEYEKLTKNPLKKQNKKL